MYGTVSDPSYSVTVNGASAVVNTDTGDWEADNVPITGAGTAVFDAVATPPDSSPTTPQVNVSAEEEVPPQVVVTTYRAKKNASSRKSNDFVNTTGTKDYYANYQPDSTGQWVLQDYQDYDDSLTSIYCFGDVDAPNYVQTDERDYQWSSASPWLCDETHIVNGGSPTYPYTYNGDLDQTLGYVTHPMDVDVYEDPSQTGWFNSVFITHYFANNVQWTWHKDSGTMMAVQVDARTEMKLLTGGKAQINRQHLIQLQCSGTEYGQPYFDAPSGLTWDGSGFLYPWEDVAETPIDKSRMRALGQWVGADGNLWVSLPDNAAMDLKLSAPFRHYDATATPTKYLLTITANYADITTNTPEYCVGQQVFLWAEWTPSLPENPIRSPVMWGIGGKYINNYYQPSCSSCSVVYTNDTSIMTNEYVTLWWVSGDSTNPPTYTASFGEGLTFANGQSVSVAANGNIKMYRPTVNPVMPYGPFGAAFYTNDYPNYLWLDGGPMKFDVSISSKYHGNFGLSQLVNFTSESVTSLLILTGLTVTTTWMARNTMMRSMTSQTQLKSLILQGNP